MRVLAAIFLPALLAVVTPVQGSLLGGLLKDISFMNGEVSDLQSLMDSFPPNYNNSYVTTEDHNGTTVEKNVSVVKLTDNGRVQFTYVEENRITGSQGNGTNAA